MACPFNVYGLVGHRLDPRTVEAVPICAAAHTSNVLRQNAFRNGAAG